MGRERKREGELQIFSHQRQKTNRDGDTGAGWETRLGKSRLGCHPLSKGDSPEKEWWRKRKKKSYFFPSLRHHTLPLCLAVRPVPSPPLGLIKQTVGPTRSVGGDKGWWDLSSAGINLCDRGLLDESDHPCWLAVWMEPAVWGDVATGKVTALGALNFKGSLHSGFQLSCISVKLKS